MPVVRIPWTLFKISSVYCIAFILTELASFVAESNISCACFWALSIIELASLYACCIISCSLTNWLICAVASATIFSALSLASFKIASLFAIIFWYFLISSGVLSLNSANISSISSLLTIITDEDNGLNLHPSIYSSISVMICSILLILSISFIFH